MTKGLLVIIGLSSAPYAIAKAELPEFDCVIEPHVVVEVSSAVEGIIEKLHVDRNDVVKKGQTLAELNAGVERATLELAYAQAEITSEIEYRQADVGFRKRQQRRVEELYQRKAVSYNERDEVVTNAKLAELQLRQAKDKQRLAELDLKKAKEVLALRSVSSPVTGIVVERFKSPGEYVYDQQPLLKLAQLDPLRVEIIVPLETYGSILAGMRAEVMPESPLEGTYEATVTTVDRVVDAASGTFGVRLNLPNPDYRLPAGLKCRVRFLPDQPRLKMTTSTSASNDVVAGSTTGRPEAGTLPSTEVSNARSPEQGADLSVALASDTLPIGSPANLMCRTLGPFENKDQVEALVSALAEDVVAVTTREEAESTITGYLVLVAPGEAGVGPNELNDRLKESSIGDRALLREGPYSGQVSVGLYSGERSAERRRAEVAALGYPVYVRPRINRRLYTWLDVELIDEGGSEMRLLKTVDRIHPELGVGIAPCRQIPGVNGVANTGALP